MPPWENISVMSLESAALARSPAERSSEQCAAQIPA